MAKEHLTAESPAVDAVPEAETKNPTESLPALASVFKPEELFEMDPIEETSLSRICCVQE